MDSFPSMCFDGINHYIQIDSVLTLVLLGVKNPLLKIEKFIMVYSSQHRTHFSFLNRRSVLKIKPTCYLWFRSQFNKAGCVVNINKALYHMKCAELTALGISNQHFCKRNCMANMILFLSCLFFFHFSQASVFKWTWFYGIKNSN